MAEEESGRKIREELISIVGSGRGSLWGGSGRVTLLSGSICISLLGGSIESGSGGGRILRGGRLMKVLGGSGEFIAYRVDHWCGGSKGRKQRR